MYIKSAQITNIRSIEDFEINFENPAGWHVLIGDNGSGKSTIIRSLALALVGPDEAPGLRADWRDWLSNKENEGAIKLLIEPSEMDKYADSKNNFPSQICNVIFFKRRDNVVAFSSNRGDNTKKSGYDWEITKGWFSSAYGPYRRFVGGSQEWSKVFYSQPKLGAHLSAFGEDIALTEATEWLIKLNYKRLEQTVRNRISGIISIIGERILEYVTDEDIAGNIRNLFFHFKGKAQEEGIPEEVESKDFAIEILKRTKVRFNLEKLTIEVIERIVEDSYKLQEHQYKDDIIRSIKELINSPEFLPNTITIESISSEGVLFRDGNGSLITVNQLSDGYRSILSLTFELIRQLIRVYGEDAVFENIRKDDMRITLPGVVLIDEIDAHLHPTWQTKIGQWFTKYFPNLQFIVTTHSPLVCRAAENGTIWKLAALGSGEKSEEVVGIDRDRLIYGNILDAYGTEEFGIVDNIKAVHKKEELVRLSKKQLAGKISPEEENKLHKLRAIFSTDATIEL